MTVTRPKSIAGSIVVSALVRGGEPEARAATAVRRLLTTIAEWEPDAALDIALRTSPSGGVAIGMRALGAPALGWDLDVAAALEGVAVMARRYVRALGVPAALTELVRDPARARRTTERTWNAMPAFAEVAWPTPLPDGGDLLRTLRRTPSGFVRMLVSATTPLERDMLREEMVTTWERGLHPDLDVVYGAPVRARTFVGAMRPGSFAPLRAVVRSWGSGLVLVAADERIRRRFADVGVADLVGHVRPLAWALAAVRLPAAGPAAPLGIPSIEAPIAERSLDPVPAYDERAVTVGTARSAQGKTVAVQLGIADFFRHAWIEGSSGTGKTTLLSSIAAGLTRHGVGVTLLEPHGQGVDATLAALEPDIASSAIVVRHGDPDTPTPLNVVRARGTAAQQAKMKAEFIDFMQAYFDPTGSGIVGPRWRRWLSLLWDAVVCVFGDEATLLHIVSVASDPDRTKRLAAAVARRDGELAARVTREIVDLRGDEAANLTAWAVSKFQPLVEHPALRAVLGSGADAVDMSRIVAEGTPLLVDLGSTQLGTTGARMLGTIWLLKHWAALGASPRPHVILVDEVHLYRRGLLPNFLAEARKFRVGVILAGQSINALDPDLQDAVEANVGSSMSFRVGLSTAPRASARLAGWPATELTRLPDLRAAATLSRGGVPTTPFLLHVAAPGLAPDAVRDIAARRELPLLRRWRVRPAVPASDATVDMGIRAVTERPDIRSSPDPSRTSATALFEQEWLAAQRRYAPGSVSTTRDAARESRTTRTLTEQD